MHEFAVATIDDHWPTRVECLPNTWFTANTQTVVCCHRNTPGENYRDARV